MTATRPPRTPETIAAVEALADRLRACRSPMAVSMVAAEIAPEVQKLAAAEPLIATDLRNLAIYTRRGLAEGWLPAPQEAQA